jgi:hypothetical protein
MKDLNQITQSLIKKSMEARGRPEPSTLPTVRLEKLPPAMRTIAKLLTPQIWHVTELKPVHGSRFFEKENKWEWDVLRYEEPELCVEDLPEGAMELARHDVGQEVILQMMTALSAIKKITKSDNAMSVVFEEVAVDYEGMPALALLMAFEKLKCAESPWFPDYHTIMVVFNDAIKRVKAIRNAQPKEKSIMIQHEKTHSLVESIPA